jgi:hypothetical protein
MRFASTRSTIRARRSRPSSTRDFESPIDGAAKQRHRLTWSSPPSADPERLEIVRTETAVDPSTRGPRAAPPPSSPSSSGVAGSGDELASELPDLRDQRVPYARKAHHAFQLPRPAEQIRGAAMQREPLRGVPNSESPTTPTDLRTQSAALGAAQDTNEWTASAFLATPNPSEARLRRASRPASARPPAISRPAYSTSTSRWPSRTHSFVSTSIRSRGPDSQDSLPDRQNRTMHALRTPAVALMRDSTSLWEIGLPGVASAKHRGMMSSLSRPTTSGAA